MNWVDWIIKYRNINTVLVFLLCVISIYGFHNFKFNADAQYIVSKNSPNLLSYNRVKDEFANMDMVLNVIDFRHANMSFAEKMAVLEEITNALTLTPHSLRVQSLSRYAFTRSQDDELTIYSIRDRLRYADEDNAVSWNEIEKNALTTKDIVNWLSSKEGDVFNIPVTLNLHNDSLKRQVQQQEAVAYIKQKNTEIQQQHPALAMHVTGSSSFDVTVMEVGTKANSIIVPLMYGVMFLLLMFFLKSWLAVVTVMIISTLANLASLGFISWLNIELSPPSSMSTNVILTVVVAQCVHMVNHFNRAGLQGSKLERMRSTIQKNLTPILFTSLTTIIGFVSLNLSDIRPVQDLGNIVAYGVFVSFLLCFSFLPAFLLKFAKDAAPQQSASSSNSGLYLAIADFVNAHYKKILLIGLPLSIVLSVLCLKNELNDNYMTYVKDDKHPFRIASQFFDDHLGGFYPINIILDAPEGENGIYDVAYLQDVEKFTEWLRQQPEITSVNSYTDILKRLNKSLHNDDDAYHRLPDTRQEAANYQLLYELSPPEGTDISDIFNYNRSATHLQATYPITDNKNTLILGEKINNWMRENTMFEFMPTGMPLLFASSGTDSMRANLQGGFLALFVISIILTLFLRSLKLGFVSLIANGLPIAIGFGIWALLYGYIGQTLIAVMGIAIGIVVDDTVHFLTHYRRNIEAGKSSPEAIRATFDSVGSALMVTSIVLVLGFMSMTLSFFRLNVEMGLLTAMVVAIAIIFDFLILPSLLLLFDGKNKQTVK